MPERTESVIPQRKNVQVCFGIGQSLMPQHMEIVY